MRQTPIIPKSIWLTAIAGLLMLAISPAPVNGALVYKNYIIRQDNGINVLCSPYIVRRGDWVLKIFKLRGEIARQDFPLFLRMFRRINPHIKDVNRIRPGQQIFIPLRRIQSGALPSGTAGVVTIPFVDLSRRTRVLNENSERYRVVRGDTVSKLIAARFGTYQSGGYRKGIRLLQQLNPDLEDLDRIYAGQVLYLPDPSLADHLEGPVAQPQPVTARAPETAARLAAEPDGLMGGPARVPPLHEAAAILEARLLDSGVYRFPTGDGRQVSLDLARHPVLELPNGNRVLMTGEQPLPDDTMAVMKSHWKQVRQLNVPRNASVEQIVNRVLTTETDSRPEAPITVDRGGATFQIRSRWVIPGPNTELNPIRYICVTSIDRPSERTPEGITRFLEQSGIKIRDIYRGNQYPQTAVPIRKRVFRSRIPRRIDVGSPQHLVKTLCETLGYPYTPNVTISFPYAGIEVKAISNLVTLPSGNPVFIDYGDLYGDALTAIRQTGFRIIQIQKTDAPEAIVDKLVAAMQIDYTRNPNVLAAERPARYNTSIRVNGLLLRPDQKGGGVLLMSSRLDKPIINLLSTRGIRVVYVDMKEKRIAGNIIER